MTGFHYEIARSLCVPGVTVEIRDYHTTEPHVYSEPRDCSYLCDLALTPRPLSAADRSDADSRRYSKVGRFLLIPPRYPLSARADTGKNRSLACVIEEEKFKTLGGEALEMLPANRLLDIQESHLEGTFRRLLRELIEPGLASTLLVESLVSIIIVDLTRHLARENANTGAAEHALDAGRLARIREIVENHDGPGLSVVTLAQACGMSPRHLLRLFRNATGMSVATYVADLRLERAMNLLSKSPLHIKEIAYRAGFSNASSFGEAFRRKTGVAPSRFRERLSA
jgi:AraC family transcriptional regulator